FELHGGVDPLSVVRAAVTSLRARKIVSGASTLTMQLARLVRPHKRNLFGKIGEMALAVKIEAHTDKNDVLEQYENRAPFGPNLRGIDAASRFYFDKPPAELSLAEACTLAGIARGPEVYGLEKHADHALRRRNRILARLHDAGAITDEDFERASREPLFVRKTKPSFGAPHLVEALAAGQVDPSIPAVKSGAVQTTIASALQAEAEQATLVALQPLAKKHVTGASVVVIDNATGEVLAYVGSPDYFDKTNGGQNDGARAKRQPGSALKPFVYGLAMEKLDFTPATVLPDVEMELPLLTGPYTPKNYDERFHGPVRLREALGSSYNVPAVWTATQLGMAPLLDRLHDAGFASLSEAPDYYGPALALGDGEVTLLELTNAYATIARGGTWKPLQFVKGQKALAPAHRVMPVAVAEMLADVLSDKNARLASFGERSVLELPFPVAAKTGTSKGFRDNWTVGFTNDVTVGVWVGNFDGSAMDGVSGITGAGPIFRGVMEAAMQGKSSGPIGARSEDLVKVEVCPLSGLAPGAACSHRIFDWMPKNHAPLDACNMHEFARIDTRTGLRAPGCSGPNVEQRSFEVFPPEYALWAKEARRPLAPEETSPNCGSGVALGAGSKLRIASPNDGASYALDPSRPSVLQALSVRIDAPRDAGHVRLLVDGRAIAAADASHVVHWQLAPGAHVLVAEAEGGGESAPVRVTVQ
ncbi:MAG TPA: penicillin-binding protein 1C, partial [Polyangiaceae bacterium]